MAEAEINTEGGFFASFKSETKKRVLSTLDAQIFLFFSLDQR